MSRPWIPGIICCFFLACLATAGRGQDYLELSTSPPAGSKPVTLTDRFLSLKSKFSREKKSKPQQQSAPSKSTSKTNPRAPRYRNTTQASLQAQRARRRSPAATARQTDAAKASSPPVAARAKAKELLPDAQLFSRGSAQFPKASQQTAKQLTRAATVPRVAGKKIQTAPRVARKSPATSRANELDSALADLLKPQVVPRSQRVTAQRNRGKQLPAAVTSNTLDLRKALLDDEEDAIAAEAAQAVEEATNSQAANKVQPPLVVTKPTVKTDQVVEGNAAPQIVAADSLPTKIETPVVAPVVTEAPQAKANPVAKAAEEPRQVITLATPVKQKEPAFTAEPRVEKDPFEVGEAKRVFNQSQSPGSSALSGNSVQSNPMRSSMPVPQEKQAIETVVQPRRRVLQTMQQPVIVSHVEGPRSILVGRESTYQVTLENTSNSPAANLSAQITVPEWAELVDAMSTSGVVERISQGASAGTLEWKLSELTARESQVLRLRLIPRSGRPLQLGIRWTQAPMQSQTLVEVQEPKLELAISGPQEVRFGKAQRYRLTLRNPGTGLTEQVSLRLIPPGGDAQSATIQTIGDLKPGEVKDLDLELTAREAGELLIQASAVAEGGLKAQVNKSVLCRKPELQVDWRGPDKKYAGTEAAYYFRVSNSGTAVTDPVDVSVKLPVGAKFISASDGYSINATTGVVSWQLASIDVKEEQFVQLRCKMSRPGVSGFEVSAKTMDGELSESKAFQTAVVALADLKLEVSDPQGPLPLGEAVIYEIRVRNRGTTSAENINVTGLFSAGIDPTTVEGAQFSVRDGRVSFHPIKSLPAGREVLLKIHAKANQIGTHVFRTEVTCQTLDIKLAAEETTRFFQDQHRWKDGKTAYSSDREAVSR